MATDALAAAAQEQELNFWNDLGNAANSVATGVAGNVLGGMASDALLGTAAEDVGEVALVAAVA